MLIVCSIIHKKRAIQRAEIERPFLAAKDFNTNLVKFLNFYRCIMFLLVTCTSTLLRAQKIIIYECLICLLEIFIDKMNSQQQRDTAFIIHVGMRQLPRQMSTYIRKRHYQVSKKLPKLVLYNTQILYFNPMIFQLEHLSCRKYC